ncbi:hypothetical protein AAG589_18680 [Isoptericola sp. F-RaC21]|uniref:hypothetical protein n=1 Tax=Isoptericola sp. F-RaC21 TaxID=3141452 RepID=UPI00315BBBD2
MQIRRRLVAPAAGALALLVAACGTVPNQGPALSPTPADVDTLTMEQLGSALPFADDELPDDVTTIARCPEEDSDTADPGECPSKQGKDSRFVTVSLHGDGEDVTVGPFATVTVARYEDVAAAKDRIARNRATGEEQSGTFRVKPKDEGDVWYPGLRGRGDVESITLGGWSGVLTTATTSHVWRDKSVSLPQPNVLLVVRSGATTLTCNAWLAPDRTVADVTGRCRGYLEDTIERIDTLRDT